MELRELEPGPLLVDAHARLVDSKLLPLEGGIPGELLLLVLLLLGSTAAVPVALDLEAETDVSLFLGSELDPANGELRRFQLKELFGRHVRLWTSRLNRHARVLVARVKRGEEGGMLRPIAPTELVVLLLVVACALGGRLLVLLGTFVR